MDLIKIIGSLGIGALGMYFMYKLCEKMLSEVALSLKDMNKTMQDINTNMQDFVREQHQEHKDIIKLIKDKKK